VVAGRDHLLDGVEVESQQRVGGLVGERLEGRSELRTVVDRVLRW
jgi:hypothetical protein